MTDPNKNLLTNLSRNAPWLMEGRNDLFPENLQGSLSDLMGDIRDNRLAIITNNGQIYEQYQSLEITNGRIKIDKPVDWNDASESFHVFFKSKHGRWNFFLAKNTVFYPSAIQIDSPENILFLQRRRYNRVLAPIGTRATFRGQDGHIDSAHVKDISEGGDADQH